MGNQLAAFFSVALTMRMLWYLQHNAFQYLDKYPTRNTFKQWRWAGSIKNRSVL